MVIVYEASVSICVGTPALSRGSLCSLALCRAPALSVSGPVALSLSVSGPGALCVGALSVSGQRSPCQGPALSRSLCVWPSALCRGPGGLGALRLCVGPGALRVPAAVLSVSGQRSLCCGPALLSLCRAPCVGLQPLRDPVPLTCVPPIRRAGPAPIRVPPIRFAGQPPIPRAAFSCSRKEPQTLLFGGKPGLLEKVLVFEAFYIPRYGPLSPCGGVGLPARLGLLSCGMLPHAVLNFSTWWVFQVGRA